MGLPASPTGSSPKSMFTKAQRKSYNSASSYLAAVSASDLRNRDKTSISSEGTTVVGDSDEDKELKLEYDHLSEVPAAAEGFSTIHTEFGHCANEEYRYTSEHNYTNAPVEHVDDPPYYILMSVYTTFLVLICLSHMRDFFGKRFRPLAYRHLMAHNVCVSSVIHRALGLRASNTGLCASQLRL